MFWPKIVSSGPAAEEARRGGVRALDELVAAAAGGERAAEVRVRLAEVRGDRVDHGRGHCVPPGASRKATPERERGELCPDRLQIDGRSAI